LSQIGRWLVFLVVAAALPAAETLSVYVGHDARQPKAPFDAMAREVESLTALLGLDVEWRRLERRDPKESSNRLIVLEFRGVCSSEPSTADVPSGASLASTLKVGESVLPFAWVECDKLRAMLKTALRDQPGARRDFLMGRAMGRLVAHELYHVLAQSREHAAGGIGKSCFHMRDLLSDDFQFDGAALAKVQHQLAGNGSPDLETSDISSR